MASKNFFILPTCLLVIILTTIVANKDGYLANASPTNSSSVPGLPLLKTRTATINFQASSIKVTCKLFSRTKMFLQIDMNGLVSGTSNCSSNFVTLELLSVGSGIKMIRGVASGRYLAMNRRGTVYSTKKAGAEAIFVDKMQSSGYTTYASSKYYQTVFYDTFVAVKRNGRVKPGHLTNKLQKPAQFLSLTALNNC